MGQKFILATIMLLAGLTSCDSFAAPTNEQKTFINSVNIKFKDKLTIEHVPTYSDYMNVKLKGDYDKNLIDSLENAYRQTISFVVFLVHDKDGKLIRGSYGSM